MKRSVLLFLLSFFISQSFTQVGIEIDGKVKINYPETQQAGAQLQKVVVKENGQLAIKASEDPVLIESPKPLPYFGNYSNFTTEHEAGYYYKHDNRVYLGGIASNYESIQHNDTIAILPPGYRPLNRLIATGFQNSKTIRLNIESTGVIRVLSQEDYPSGYLGLTGISFPYTFELGQEIGGGYLFYVCDPPEDLNGDGVLDQGLVAAPFDLANASWGCSSVFMNTSYDGIGDGISNTEAIVTNCSEPSIAARLCDDLELNGYTDWHLPSLQEIELIWEILADSDGDGINQGINDPFNIGNFETAFYATSTEETEYQVWQKGFTSGVSNIELKSGTYKVRAIRILEVE